MVGDILYYLYKSKNFQSTQIYSHICIKICLRLFTVLFTPSGEVREGGKKGSYEFKYPTEGNDQIYPGIFILQRILFSS